VVILPAGNAMQRDLAESLGAEVRRRKKNRGRNKVKRGKRGDGREGEQELKEIRLIERRKRRRSDEGCKRKGRGSRS
jgi:hypothetical protein